MPLPILLAILATILGLSRVGGRLMDEGTFGPYSCLPAILLCLLPFAGLLTSLLRTKHSAAKSIPARIFSSNVPAILIHWAWLLAVVALFNGTRYLDSVSRIGQLESLHLLLAFTPPLVAVFFIWLLSSWGQSGSLGQAWNESICRIKLNVLTILIPVLFVILIKDLSQTKSFNESAWLQVASFISGTVLLIVLMPFIVSWILPTVSIVTTKLGNELVDVSIATDTPLGDIRIWDTGHRMVNALIVGMTPWTRTVLLTDLLVRKLEPDEIKAVFLHEVGHAKRNHLFQRLVASGLPFLLVFAIGETCGLYQPFSVAVAVTCSLFGLAIVARFLEYDADLFAIEQMIKLGIPTTAYQSALIKIMLENPNSDKHSWSHPRISERIGRIRRLNTAVIKSD